jgi:hypothetical protein
MALSVTLKAGIRGNQTSALDLGTVALPIDVQASIALDNGTGANQADKVFTDTRTVTTGATDSLDLAGTLTDAFGVTFTIARVKAILVKAASANTTDLSIARPAANGLVLFSAASDAIVIKPGGVFFWAAPDATAIPVTAGTGDLLSIINAAGASANYDLVIVGASA